MNQSFVSGHVDTFAGPVPRVDAALSWRDRLGGWKVRWGIARYSYTVDPGLYAVGEPDDTSPVLATANYKLSFDALRRRLTGRSAWILALDTRGINVWCAAGKRTFGTDELVRRIAAADLPSVVSHRTIVLPQLGAPGVSAPIVKGRSGYRIVWGPVRATDVGAFLDADMKATPEMRRVTFTIGERGVLLPVEMVSAIGIGALAVAIGAVVAGFGPGVFSLGRTLSAAGTIGATVGAMIFAGAVVTPLLLPWIPGRMFATKGALVGALVALAVLPWLAGGFAPVRMATLALVIIGGSSYLAMNFTGTSTFTSLSGVLKEMRAWLPWQVGAAALALVLWVAGGFIV